MGRVSDDQGSVRAALPLARTNAEAHLYMSLQPCPTCGETRCQYRSSVVRLEGAPGGVQHGHWAGGPRPRARALSRRSSPGCAG